MSEVAAGAFEMGYLRFGRGERPLVILPGLSVQSVLPAAEAICRQYAAFRDDFTVYLFDRRNALPARYSVYDAADDTAEAMRALGLRDACVFGASQGGMAAMALAAGEPSLVSRLALGSTAARLDDRSTSVLREWIALARKKDAEALYLSFGRAIYPETVFQSFRSALSVMAGSVTEEELCRFVTLAEGTFGFDIRGRLPKIACPVLVLGDTDDAVFGADAADEIAHLLEGCPNAKVHMTCGFGHAAYDTAPDYAQRLFAFFKATPHN